MQGAVFVNYITDFHTFIVENGLADGKLHILVLDGHASHVNFDVIQLAMSLETEPFQLPSHSSLDVMVFGCFKKAATAVLSTVVKCRGNQTWPGWSRMRGATSFTVPQIKVSL